MPSASDQIQHPVTFEAIKTRTRREYRLISRALHRVPKKARTWLAVFFGLLVLASLYLWLSAGSSTLAVVGSHSFRRVQVSLWIDGKLQFDQQFSGAVKKRYGLFGNKTEGSFSRNLYVSSGEHQVQVRVQSPGENYDETRQYKVNFVADQTTKLNVSATHGQLSLNVQSPAIAETHESSSGFLTFARSMFLTIGGSIISAAIGFLVQDFLKSKKLSSSPKITA